MAAVRMYNFGTLRQFCRSALTFGSARASALIFHQLLPEMLRILTLLTLATCGACGAECGEECVNDVNVASEFLRLYDCSTGEEVSCFMLFLHLLGCTCQR